MTFFNTVYVFIMTALCCLVS